jgi:hypothetical protein
MNQKLKKRSPKRES